MAYRKMQSDSGKKRTISNTASLSSSKKVKVSTSVAISTSATIAADLSATGTNRTTPARVSVLVPESVTSQSHLPPRNASYSNTSNNNNGSDINQLRQDFIDLFTMPAHVHRGVSNTALKERFGGQYTQLASIINDLTKQSRLTMSKYGEELHYNLVSEQLASKFIVAILVP